MNCPRCGNQLPEGAVSCPHCVNAGQAVPPPPITPTIPYYPQAPTRTSGMAIASLILGILGIGGCLFSIPALILGIIARNEIGNEDRGLSGRGMATAGIVLACVGFVMVPITAAILFPVFAKAREKARQTTCVSRMHQITTAALIYTADHGEKLPSDSTIWNDLKSQLKDPNSYQCPSDSTDGDNISYGYNCQIANWSIGNFNLDEPHKLVIFADSEKSDHRISSAKDFEPRHIRQCMMGFLDGHIELLNVDAPVTIIPISKRPPVDLSPYNGSTSATPATPYGYPASPAPNNVSTPSFDNNNPPTVNNVGIPPATAP